MDKKYKLTDETILVDGHTLHRIQALRAFRDIEAGELGGFIEGEDNLSHEGNCWVFDDAKVYDHARVNDDAIVFDEAKVYGRAMIGDYASVFGKAKVYDNAKVFNEAWVYNNARVYGKAQVYGKAGVLGDTKVYGNARVYEYAQVYNNAKVYGNAKVFGFAQVFCDAKVYEKARVFDKAKVFGEVTVRDKALVSGEIELDGHRTIDKVIKPLEKSKTTTEANISNDKVNVQNGAVDTIEKRSDQLNEEKCEYDCKHESDETRAAIVALTISLIYLLDKGRFSLDEYIKDLQQVSAEIKKGNSK